MSTSTPKYEDSARAARLVSALAAEDHAGVEAVLTDAKNDDRLVLLALALAIRHVQVCAEFYGTDMRKVLDEFAFDANAMANRERAGDE